MNAAGLHGLRRRLLVKVEAAPRFHGYVNPRSGALLGRQSRVVCQEWQPMNLRQGRHGIFSVKISSRIIFYLCGVFWFLHEVVNVNLFIYMLQGHWEFTPKNNCLFIMVRLFLVIFPPSDCGVCLLIALNI